MDPTSLFLIVFNLVEYSEAKLYTWLQSIKVHGKGASMVLLVATHIDLLREEEIEERLSGIASRYFQIWKYVLSFRKTCNLLGNPQQTQSHQCL